MGPLQTGRAHAEKVANQFEAILVRQLVGSLRQSSKVGDSGGMFGGGVGSDTYSDWFDQHLANHIGSSNQIGIKEEILRGIERAGQLHDDGATAEAARKTRFAAQAANRSQLLAVGSRQGGIDVTH